jgi:putative hydrolase of the HAD superfamily
MIKAVVFDLDNTLLDFMKMKNTAVEAAVSRMIFSGLEIKKEIAIDKIYSIYDSKGYEYQEVFDQFLIDTIGKIDYKILASGIIAYKKAKESSLMLYKNVNETLLTLTRMGLRLAVISDAPSREAWVRICSVNLEHTFDAVITLHDKGIHKPSPEPFKEAIKSLNVKPEETFMVGDWPERDIIGAKNVGMRTAFAKYGDTFNTKNSGADFVLNDISDLINIINNINS